MVNNENQSKPQTFRQRQLCELHYHIEIYM